MTKPHNHDPKSNPIFCKKIEFEPQEGFDQKYKTAIVMHTNESQSKSFPMKPLHIRIREYNIARERIFNEPVKKSRSASRIKSFWEKIKSLKKKLICSMLDRPADVRPYAEVTLFGKRMLGLLDTGASISCIGSSAAKSFLESHLPYKN